MSFNSKVLFHTKFFLPTVSQKQAVNKKDSVGTIAYMPGLRLWKDLLVDNETIAHAMRYIMPQKKLPHFSPWIISKRSILKLSLHHGKSFHAAPTLMQW